EVRSEAQALGHGSVLRLENLGVGDASGLELLLTTEQGVAGPSLLHRGLGLQARALVGLGAGETLRLRRDDGRGLAAEILPASGPPCSGSKARAGTSWRGAGPPPRGSIGSKAGSWRPRGASRTTRRRSSSSGRCTPPTTS